MLAPTPMLRPGPLDISGLLAGSVEAVKRRFGLFVLIVLFPSLVALVIIGGGLGIAVAAIAAAGSPERAVPAVLLVALIVMIVGAIASVLTQLKAQAMLVLAAYEIAQGQRPDLRGLLGRTRGFLPRIAAVIALVALAVALLVAIVITIVVLMVMALNGNSGGQAAATAGLLVLLVLAMIPVAFALNVKLLYTIPAVTIEQRPGLDAMKRSWQLTRGAFWRTLGYYLIAALVAGAASSLASLLGQLVAMPALTRADGPTDVNQLVAMLLAMLPLWGLVFFVQVVVQLAIQPFLHAYVTYMFVDQVRRSEAAAPAFPDGSGASASLRS